MNRGTVSEAQWRINFNAKFRTLSFHPHELAAENKNDRKNEAKELVLKVNSLIAKLKKSTNLSSSSDSPLNISIFIGS